MNYLPPQRERVGVSGASTPTTSPRASGIISDKEADVLAAFASAGSTLERRIQSGDWVSLVYAD